MKGRREKRKESEDDRRKRKYRQRNKKKIKDIRNNREIKTKGNVRFEEARLRDCTNNIPVLSE